MRNPLSRRDAAKSLAAFAACGVLTSRAVARSANDLRIGGTGSSIELVRQLASAFCAQRPNAMVSIVPGLGSTGGAHAVIDRALDIAVMGREPRPDEVKLGIHSRSIGRTPFVLATSHPNPGSIRCDDVARMIADARATWPDGTPVRFILRPRSDADSDLMASLFPKAEHALEEARRRPDIPIAASDQDNAAMGETVSGSLIGLTLMQLKTERRDLRVIPIDGAVPSLPAYLAGRYPYGRDLHVATAKGASVAAQEFCDFIRSAAATKYFLDADCQPAS